MKTIRIILITSILLGSIALTGCGKSEVGNQSKNSTADKSQSSSQPSSQPKSENSGPVTINIGEKSYKVDMDVQALILKQQQVVKDQTDEISYYKDYVKTLTSTLAPDKFQDYINKEWTYSLSVNKINFPTDGMMKIADSTFDLVLSESKAKYSILSNEDSTKGKLTSDITTSLGFPDSIKFETKKDIKENISTITYSFKDVPAHSIIHLSLSQDLKTKLGITTDTLQIQVN